MAAKETKKTIDISDFFTTSKEKSGVWYEAKIDGIGTGLEFKLLGYASDENVLSAAEYSKQHELVEAEEDPVKSSNMERDAVCKRISSIITDIRAKDGNEIKINGEPLKYSKELVYQILWENIEIRTDLFRATMDSSTFMTKKL